MARAAIAQVSSVYGSLRVRVTDATGAAIPGATVEATLPERSWSRSARTAHDGIAHFASLPPGEYAVEASSRNFAAQSARVSVLLGHEGFIRFTLSPAAQKTEVTVSAAAEGGIDSYTIPVHTHVNSEEVQGLPINRRNFLDFALLDPAVERDTLRVHAVAVTSGFNVMGQRPRSNSLQMDGADLNDESTGGVRGSVPMEAVQEFQILTNGYQAGYGRAAGGVVNVVTRSGGNELHGLAFGFLRHRSLDATNAFSNLREPPYTRVQYGASLNGPLRRHRSFFFFSFEELRRQESGFSRIGGDPGVLSLTSDQVRLRAADPMHAGIVAAERGLAIARSGLDPATGAPPPYHVTALDKLGGVYPVSERNGASMARFDHELSHPHRLAARLNYAHSNLSALEAQNNDQVAGLVAFDRTAALKTQDPTAVASLSSVLSAASVNDARFSWARRRFDMTPNSLAAPVNIPGAGFLGRESILPHYRTESHIHLDDAFTASIARHVLRLGGDLMVCPTQIEYHRLANGQFTFGPQPAPAPGAPQLTPVQAYGLGLASNFVQQFGNPRAGSGKTSLGLFAQDSWRIGPRLTLDIGLRYDLESATARNPSDPKMETVYRQLAIRRSPPTDRNNAQPRLGFGYQLLENGKLTLRGSYGLFYDRLLNLATYLAAVGDGSQITRVILSGSAAATVFQSPAQRLGAYPAGVPPTGLIAFSDSWKLGQSQQGNLLLSSQIRPNLVLDAGYVWGKGTHLARSRDYNPTDSSKAAEFLAAGNPQAALLGNNFFRPIPAVSEVMAFEGSASSVYHGLRASLRGRINARTYLSLSYTFSKAIDDAEEIFPHTRAQNMKDFRAERGLSLYDQRHRFVLAGLWETGATRTNAPARLLLNNWTIAPIVEAGTGRPVNVLLGFDNNLDQEPSSDRPDVVPHGTAGAVETRLGAFRAPAPGTAGNLGRNAFIGPGFASVSLRLQRRIPLTERVAVHFITEGFNLLNRVNIRAVNPNFERAGDPLAAHDPRQIQVGIQLRF